MRGHEVNEADPGTLEGGRGSVGVALLLAATQGTAAAGAATSAAVRGMSGGDGPGWSGNLIADGNAGAGYCTRDWNAATTIPGWSVRTGSPNVMCYSAARVRHPAGAAGQGFFSSGPYGDSAMTQTARLAPAGRGGPVPVLPAVRLAGRVEDRARLRDRVAHLPRPVRAARPAPRSRCAR